MKKIAIITSSILLILAASYAGIWYFTKHKVETYVATTFNQLKNDSKFKYVTYDLNVSCFPFLCVELKDVKIKTDKYFAKSQKGYEFEAFKEYPLAYNVKNILKDGFIFKQNQASYDFMTKNLDDEKEVKFLFNFDKLSLNLANPRKEITIEYADIEASAANSAFLAVASVNKIDLNYQRIKKSPELSDFEFGYALSKLKIFNKGASKKPLAIKHSILKAEIKDLANATIFSLATAKSNSQTLSLKTLQSLADNRTNLIIQDFKIATDNSRGLFKGQILIDTDKRLRTNFDSSIAFVVENSYLEKMLQESKINKHESGIYFINGRTNEEIININNIFKFPRPRIF